ncbi:MAG: cupin domain-containing protein [Phaeodactylibacter sp.]|nr:cupin domain-containing protein [Phaeodactylibacter sp.]MCB9050307.1 cupin domain-containing protein [Lewinellaceae bacterium]
MAIIKKSIDQISPFTAGDDTLIREVLHPRNDDLALGYSLAFAVLEPGRASLPHILKKSDEVYAIGKGRGRAFIDGEAADVGPGDVVVIPAGARQYIENTGDEHLEFWCIVSPPWNEEDELVED